MTVLHRAGTTLSHEYAPDGTWEGTSGCSKAPELDLTTTSPVVTTKHLGCGEGACVLLALPRLPALPGASAPQEARLKPEPAPALCQADAREGCCNTEDSHFITHMRYWQHLIRCSQVLQPGLLFPDLRREHTTATGVMNILMHNCGQALL